MQNNIIQTKVLSGSQAINLGAEIIKSGGIVVFPTETVYGLGANAFDEQAVKKIFIAKGRPMDNPLIAHVCNKKQIEQLACDISPQAMAVIDNFMPGAITVILKKSKIVGDCVTAGLDTVGIRMPSHPIAKQFIEACGCPIVAPSANTSTRISPTCAKHVEQDMQGKVPLIIDGGDCEVGIESTIIDMTTPIPTILRPGGITAHMLAQVLGKVSTFKGQVVVAKAPGMKYKHYAPDCDMIVSDGIDKTIEHYDIMLEQGKVPIILCSSQWEKYLGNRKLICLGDNAISICHGIYGALHTAQNCADYIICQDFGDSGIFGSVMNRINKASGGKKL